MGRRARQISRRRAGAWAIVLAIGGAVVLAASGARPPLGGFENATDIGAVQHKGASEFVPEQNVYRVTGSGENIWGARDALHFAWRRAAGDLVLTADLDWVGRGTNPHRKAGWMVRQ